MRPYIWFLSLIWLVELRVQVCARALVSDKGADAATGIGHLMHTSATTGLLKSSFCTIINKNKNIIIIIIVTVTKKLFSIYNYNQ
jgi:hypothetical protein